MTEEFFKEHMFPHTSDSVLTTLGSMSCLVSPSGRCLANQIRWLNLEQFMTLGGIVAGKLADR